MAEVKPASRMVSGQFINVQRLHVAKLLTDEAGGEAAYDTPVDLGKVLRSIDIKPSNSSAELYADGQSIDTANNTASYELTFDTATLPLEYVAYLLGHRCENGVMVANKDDVAPYFAVMFQSDKRNGSKRLMKFFGSPLYMPINIEVTEAECSCYARTIAEALGLNLDLRIADS